MVNDPIDHCGGDRLVARPTEPCSSRWPSRNLTIKTKRAVIVSKVTRQRVVIAAARATELLPHSLRCRDMGIVGDGHVARPHAGVIGNDTTIASRGCQIFCVRPGPTERNQDGSYGRHGEAGVGFGGG